jgi:hypothetical protein
MCFGALKLFVRLNLVGRALGDFDACLDELRHFTSSMPGAAK